MKYLFFSLLLTLPAQADEPLPPNPFANLPTSQEAGSNPFDDTGRSTNPPRRAPSLPNQHPRFDSHNTPAPPLPGNPDNQIGQNTANKAKGDPANSKEVVENFDYPDTEIIDVAKAVSKLTGKNFIYNAQDTKGKISIVSETAITVGDAWNAFLTALNMKGFVLIPSGKFLRIDRIVNAKEKQTAIYSEKNAPNNDEFITRVIPLRYIDATEFESTFRLWMPRESRMQAYGQTNTLIITDTSSHISRMVELISMLDIAGYQESLVVIPIKNAAAKDISKLIEQIISDQKSAAPANPYGGRPAVNYSYPAYGGTAGGSKGQSRGGSTITKIIADDRTNCLIVKANAAGIVEVRSLVRRLDTKIAANSNSDRIHVIRLQFADAEELAKTLSTITSGGSASKAGATPGGAPGIPNYLSTLNTAAAFQSDIKVSADKVTQSLVVSGSPQDFATFKKVVEQLDIPQDQVFVQAILMEITLSRGGNYGTSFIAPSSGIALPSASSALQNILSGNPVPQGFTLGFAAGAAKAVGLGNSSSSGTTTSSTPMMHALTGLIELVQANTDTNIIATPQIVALDNKESTIEIAQQIPQATTTQNGTSSTTGYNMVNASLLLKLTPRINKASNYVKLDIEQKLENFDGSQVPAAVLANALGKNSRDTKTSAIVQNEDTVVLSGLMRTDIQKQVQKVPILGDIPIIGWLFKNEKTSNIKTNLIVFITPTIVKQYATMRKILNARVDDHNDFVNEVSGAKDTDDDNNKVLHKIQKGLPKLDEITPLPSAQPQTNEDSYIPAPANPDREDDQEIYPEPGADMSQPMPYQLDPPGISPPQVGIGPSQTNMPGDNAAPPVIPQQLPIGE